MLKASEVRIITEIAKSALRKRSVEKTLEWCEECEDKICFSAEHGHTSAPLGVPKDVTNEFFTKDDRNAIIEVFFNELGYKVRFQNGFIVEW